MSDENLVHEEWACELVPAPGHGDKFYRVSYGTVCWSGHPEDLRRAVTVFMQKGNTEDFQEAKSNNEIQYRMTAHILDEDIDAVTAAIARVRRISV